MSAPKHIGNVNALCPECGAIGFRADLDTTPPVYGCESCLELFTAAGRRPLVSPRHVRRVLVRRWDQLADDIARLVEDIRNAPDGTFTDEERREAAFELDNTVWDVMVNSRPRLPGSRYPHPRSRRSRKGGRS